MNKCQDLQGEDQVTTTPDREHTTPKGIVRH